MDTIAAIATALGGSGIGIIRISGFESLELIEKIFKPKKDGKKISQVQSHTIHYGHIEKNGYLIDEV